MLSILIQNDEMLPNDTGQISYKVLSSGSFEEYNITHRLVCYYSYPNMPSSELLKLSSTILF